MATKTAKTATSRNSSVRKSDENNEISKSIIQDVIFGCEKMGIKAEVLKNLHAVWLMKIKESDPNFYKAIDTEWNNLKKAKKLKDNEKPKIKNVKRLISKFRPDGRSSSEKENLNIVGAKLKKNLKRNPILLNKKITQPKIALSMPLLDDEIDVSHKLKQFGHGTLITKNTGNISFNGRASKCNIKNDKLALNVQHLGKTEFLNTLHLGDINILQNITLGPKYDCLKQNEKSSEINNENKKYDIKIDDVVLQSGSKVDFHKKFSQSTSDGKNILDYYPELVKRTDLDHLVNNEKVGKQTIIENENFDYSINACYNDKYDHFKCVLDEYEKQLPSIKAIDMPDDDIKIKQDLPILPLRRKHSIKACGRNHRQADINEQNWEINSRYYQVICAGRFLRSRFDYSKLDEAFLDVVIFLPNRDPDKDEKRTCIIKVSSMLLKDNILDLIINPLLNTVKIFSEPEAAFVLQKSVDLIMEQIVAYQMDGLPSFKFRLEQTNKYSICSSKKKLLYDEIDSDDDISGEDDLNTEYENSIYCCYKKITKKRNLFYIQLYNGVIKVNGKERYFNTLKGIAIFQ